MHKLIAYECVAPQHVPVRVQLHSNGIIHKERPHHTQHISPSMACCIGHTSRLIESPRANSGYHDTTLRS